MSRFVVRREHELGFDEAKRVAEGWVKRGQSDLGMQCTARSEADCEVIDFKATGVEGTLTVTATEFVLEAKLGFLFQAFEGKIRSKIEQNLDKLLGPTK